jgi:hypothetical protein
MNEKYEKQERGIPEIIKDLENTRKYLENKYKNLEAQHDAY